MVYINGLHQKIFHGEALIRIDIQANKSSIMKQRSSKENTNSQSGGEPTAVAALPYIKSTAEQIERILRKRKIRTNFTNAKMLNPKTSLHIPEVYKSPCSRGKVFRPAGRFNSGSRSTKEM